MRFKIENKGFNDQKNNGFNLEHRFSRKSKNYYRCFYSCLQIAHVISQIIESTKSFKKIVIKTKHSVSFIFNEIKNALTSVDVSLLEMRLLKKVFTDKKLRFV